MCVIILIIPYNKWSVWLSVSEWDNETHCYINSVFRAHHPHTVCCSNMAGNYRPGIKKGEDLVSDRVLNAASMISMFNATRILQGTEHYSFFLQLVTRTGGTTDWFFFHDFTGCTHLVPCFIASLCWCLNTLCCLHFNTNIPPSSQKLMICMVSREPYCYCYMAIGTGSIWAKRAQRNNSSLLHQL